VLALLCFTSSKPKDFTNSKPQDFSSSKPKPHPRYTALAARAGSVLALLCFTSSKVLAVLVVKFLVVKFFFRAMRHAAVPTQFTCFTSTKVRILTPARAAESPRGAIRQQQQQQCGSKCKSVCVGGVSRSGGWGRCARG
jgi:hypothetical protein